MKPHHIFVEFGSDILPEEQGHLLLQWERRARELLGKPVEVFKKTMGDDSKLRIMMTPAERSKL